MESFPTLPPPVEKGGGADDWNQLWRTNPDFLSSGLKEKSPPIANRNFYLSATTKGVLHFSVIPSPAAVLRQERRPQGDELNVREVRRRVGRQVAERTVCSFGRKTHHVPEFLCSGKNARACHLKNPAEFLRQNVFGAVSYIHRRVYSKERI